MIPKFIILSAAVCCASLSLLKAQPAGPEPASLERRMNILAIDALKHLEETSGMTDRQSGREFMAVFESAQSPVFCDLYSSDAFLEMIPVQQYVEEVVGTDDSGKFTSVSYEFRDIRKSSWSFEDGRWHCTVALKKSLNYFDGNFVYYPMSGQNPGHEDFDLLVELSFNETCSECRIAGISCVNADGFRRLDPHYLVVEKNTDPADARRDEGILVGKRPVEYNEFGQGYASGTDISFWDDDMKVTMLLKQQTEKYDYVRFKYKSRHLRLKLRNEYSPFYAYSFSGISDEMAAKSSSAYSVGLDIGYSLTAGRKFKIGFYTGLGVSFSEISLTSSPIEYSYRTSVQGSNTPYTRKYEIDQATQGAGFTDLFVPVYISPEFRLHRSVSLFLNLGAKAYFNTLAKNEPFHVKGWVSALYDNGTSVSGGELDADYKYMISAVTFMRRPVDIAVAGDVGLNINLYDRMVYMELRAGYEQGLTWSYKSSESEFFSPRSVFPLVYDYRYGEVVTRPLADCVSFKRKALWFSIGLMLKL